MLCLGTVYSWGVLRVEIEQVLGLTTWQSGLPYMVSLGFYAFFMLLTGKVIDKIHPRHLGLMGALLVGFGWLASGFVTNVWLLTLTYGVVSGAGVGILYGLPIAVVSQWFPTKKGLVVGLVLVGFGLSPLITAPFLRNLLESFSLRQAFWIMGSLFIVILPLLTRFLHYPSNTLQPLKTDGHKDKSQCLTTSEMVQTRAFKNLYLNFFLGTCIGLTMIGLTANIGIETSYLSPRSISLWMSVFALSNGIGRPIFGYICDKFGSRLAMRLSYGMMIGAALLMLVSQTTVGVFVVAFSIFWLNLGAWLAIAPTTTASLFGPTYQSKNYGLVFTAYGFGAIFGTLASSFLKESFNNYHILFYAIILLCVIGLSTTFMIKKQVPA